MTSLYDFIAQPPGVLVFFFLFFFGSPVVFTSPSCCCLTWLGLNFFVEPPRPANPPHGFQWRERSLPKPYEKISDLHFFFRCKEIRSHCLFVSVSLPLSIRPRLISPGDIHIDSNRSSILAVGSAHLLLVDGAGSIFSKQILVVCCIWVEWRSFTD